MHKGSPVRGWAWVPGTVIGQARAMQMDYSTSWLVLSGVIAFVYQERIGARTNYRTT
jgi:hypothetical protein